MDDCAGCTKNFGKQMTSNKRYLCPVINFSANWAARILRKSVGQGGSD